MIKFSDTIHNTNIFLQHIGIKFIINDRFLHIWDEHKDIFGNQSKEVFSDINYVQVAFHFYRFLSSFKCMTE